MLSVPYDMGGMLPRDAAIPQPMPITALASALANATPEQQRTMLGENLYPLVVDQLEHEHAAKVTGMLLEMDQTEVRVYYGADCLFEAWCCGFWSSIVPLSVLKICMVFVEMIYGCVQHYDWFGEHLSVIPQWSLLQVVCKFVLRVVLQASCGFVSQCLVKCTLVLRMHCRVVCYIFRIVASCRFADSCDCCMALLEVVQISSSLVVFIDSLL
ncbi:Polyadenylate-binding protein 8 [Sesamum angolense]|uniref:Polyadenylate-binding protein 8 n=1 Tax=Sesamum angolense TaxID=2727404 RepID=A0AAE1X7E9_9LAMI|nr:Polyadenylate-binding protein 8 [Sesamum angolense]